MHQKVKKLMYILHKIVSYMYGSGILFEINFYWTKFDDQ